jgi:hypothetical protein
MPEDVSPPHIIISLSVQTAVCPSLPVGALVVEVAIQLSVLGLYLPPVLKSGVGVGVGVVVPVGIREEARLALYLPRVSS